MNLTIIAAALPPQLDGIGDYTAHLAAELARTVSVTILTGAPAPTPIPGVRIETVFSATDPASVQGIADFVKTNPPDWMLLQYNPFSYGKWGRNLYLPRVLARIKRDCPQTRLALMVHEPFVPIITPQFAVMATWQRWQLWRLGQTADVVFFSIDPWTKRFGRWFPGKPVVHLPVGSNIPRVPISRQEARARLGISNDTIVLGLFGSIRAGWTLESVHKAALALKQSGYAVQILYIGPHKALVCSTLSGIKVIADGPAPAEEVSRRFSAMDIYLALYIDGVSTRRTTLMAALQHGVATVSERGYNTDAILDAEDGKSFLLASSRISQMVNDHVKEIASEPELQKMLVRNGQEFYIRHFTWGRISSKLMASLKAAS